MTLKKKNKISRNKKHNYWNLKLSDKFNNRLDKGEETINKMKGAKELFRMQLREIKEKTGQKVWDTQNREREFNRSSQNSRN